MLLYQFSQTCKFLFNDLSLLMTQIIRIKPITFVLQDIVLHMKMTRHNLKKTEVLLEELGYEIIYERGNFKSGYCIVEHKKVVVVNKFYDVEARINCLIDILDIVEFEPSILSKESKVFFRKLTHQESELPIVE